MEEAFRASSASLLPRRHPPAPGPPARGRARGRSRPDGDRRVPDGPNHADAARPARLSRSPAPRSCSIRAVPADAWLPTEPEQLYEMIGWEDDRTRCRLYRAEVASRIGERSSRRPVARGGGPMGASFRLGRASVPVSPGPRRRIAINEGAISRPPGSRSTRACTSPASAGSGSTRSSCSACRRGLELKTSDATAADTLGPRGGRDLLPRPSASSSGAPRRRATCWAGSLAAQDRQAEARPILEQILSLRRRIRRPSTQADRGVAE